MFPFQQIPNSYLPLNLDLASQPVSLSSFVSKPELSNRMSQMYYPDAQAYANIPSLLTKRPPSVELNAPPTKHIHQDSFAYQPDMLRMKELAKPHVAPNSLEELNAQKLLMRSQPDLYGLTKAQALAGQQLSGFPNGISLQGLNLGQAEAQGFLSENPNTAYLKQLLELNGMSGRDATAQLNAQMNELALQKQMANLYALQNGLQQNAAGLQDLASLAGLGGLGNIGNLGGLGNLSQIQNLGGLGGLGNLAQLGGLGGLNNIASLNNLSNLNNSLTLELLNQSRSQQQQLLQLQQQQQQQQQQQPLGNVQSLASLQEMLKGSGVDPRNLSMNDLLLLNSGISNGMGQLPAMNIPTSLAQLQQQQQQTTPHQNVLLQKADSQQQQQRHQQQQQQGGAMARRDSSDNYGMAQKQQMETHHHNKRPIEIVEEGKGPVKPVVLVKPDNNKPKRDIAENTAFRPRVVEQQDKEREQQQQQMQMKQVDMKGKKIEISNNVMMHNNHHHHHANSQESAWDSSRDPVLERRKNRPLQLQAEQLMEKSHQRESFVAKKPTTPEYERSQRQGSFSVSLDFEKKRQSQTPQAGNKGIRIENVTGRDLFNKKNSDKMPVEKERKKPAPFGNGVSVSPYKANNKSNMVIENNSNSNPFPQGQFGVAVGENDHSIMAKEHEGPQKIIITKRGPEFQAQIPELILNDEDEDDFKRRKQLRNVWDPLSVNPRDIANYVRELERVLGVKVISQEKALRLLIKKDMSFEKEIETAKLNERQYGSLLGISTCARELRSRKTVDG